MINVSDTFKQKLQDGERVWQEVEITFPGGTVKQSKTKSWAKIVLFLIVQKVAAFRLAALFVNP